ncbi:HEPN domain-containing protein [Herbaspirillum frisingense]|uniref:RiboL-PSP-HEPN domain-containing protein n=1 Tax=Herbaspirillum frisingense TaxID=92645 RepID=A0ABU1PC64_9BURK|nr:HEPN domain-containing protein [Herbaspirillum frisingense]MDR6583516.1 hypothetical protein [Herbaspirillum frisingense]
MEFLLFEEFVRDLRRVGEQLDLVDTLKVFTALNPPESLDANGKEFVEQAVKVHTISREVHTDFPILTGTLTLYIAGRFESFSRSLFEDLCQRLVQKATNFRTLPKKMQDALIFHTAVVAQSPRKYGFGDGAVATFIANLSNNLSNTASIDAVNHQCLSITDANMKADMLKDLFERIGVSDFWKKIGQQASVQAHFGTGDPSSAESQAKTELNALMDLRNNVAHPSGAITWPSQDKVRGYIKFLTVLAKALNDLTMVFEVALCPQPQAS